MENWTNEDVKLVEKFIDIRRRGFYVDSGQLTDVYNRVLGKNVRPTNCGSCLSQRVKELEVSLNHHKAKLAKEQEEEKKQEETNNVEQPAPSKATRPAKSRKKGTK